MNPTQGTIRSLRDRGDELKSRAARNLDKWGLQTSDTLFIVAGEELGELARALLEAKGGELGSVVQIREEALDLGAVCLQIAVLADVVAGPAFERKGSGE